MSAVWYCVPSARNITEANACFDKWRAMGYSVAVWRDNPPPGGMLHADAMLTGKYPGYANAVNALVKMVLRGIPACNWVVTGGDDTDPDPMHQPEDIALDCEEHFGGTWGVMQPTGDRFADGCIDRICGSPWMGRSWCERAHGGLGPLHPGFYHMHVDEALQEYAKMLGVLWQRRDLTHYHHHFTRVPNADKVDWNRQRPAFLAYANSPEHWAESRAILDRLKAEKFRSCLPL